jgi:3-hydroxymyristoyl/3-hydroxydecanoyl-(acyl carrier protein) dehydratase
MEDSWQLALRAGRRKPLWTDGPATRVVDLGRGAVERLLPHRDPFLFVDRISHVDAAQRAIRAHRTIDPRDPVFTGHFPGLAVYPGALGVETFGQAGLCLIALEMGALVEPPARAPRAVRAVRVHDAQFLGEVLPGDALTLEATLLEGGDYTAVCAGQLRRGDVILSLGVIEVYFPDA